jgi:hypothetical protein
MPPLLCLSPVLIDQSFPRDSEQLRMVATALGEVFAQVRSGRAKVLLTLTLKEFLDEIDWQQNQSIALLRQIHRELSQLFLQTHGTIVIQNLGQIKTYLPHPIPASASNAGFVEFWSDELGKLLILHDARAYKKEFFIGIACELAFSGGILGSYPLPHKARAFPLVGPQELPKLLEDAFEWDVPIDCHTLTIGVDDICRNFRQLGAIQLEQPYKDSHYKIYFPDGLSWTFDRNWGRDIGDNVLQQLKPRTGMPLGIIKYCLKEGKRPPKKLRLDI